MTAERIRMGHSVGKHGNTLADLRTLINLAESQDVPEDARVDALTLGQSGWATGNMRLELRWTTVLHSADDEPTSETEENPA